MARVEFVKLVDDLDGSDADESVRFNIDGVDWDIDLSDVHAKELREALVPYVNAGRRVRPGSTGRRTSAPGHGAAQRQELATIRAWAERAGYHVSQRGRIPAHIVAAYETNTPNPAATVELVDKRGSKDSPKRARTAPVAKFSASTR